MSARDIALAIFVMVCWGGNFVAAKYGMQHLPPFMFTALRFALVALLLVPFVAVPRGHMKKIALLATVLGAGHFGFMIAGMWYGLDIATTVITAQLGVPVACLMSAFFLGDRLGFWRSTGMLVAFAGIVMVVGTPQIGDRWLGVVMVSIGALGFATSTIIMKGMRGVNTFSMLAWMSLFSVPQILLLSLLMEQGHVELFSTLPLNTLLSALYSAVASTIIAYGLWFYLMRCYDVSLVTPFSLLSPIFGIACGQIFFAEALSLQTVLGGVVTILGVTILVWRRPKLKIVGGE